MFFLAWHGFHERIQLNGISFFTSPPHCFHHCSHCSMSIVHCSCCRRTESANTRWSTKHQMVHYLYLACNLLCFIHDLHMKKPHTHTNLKHKGCVATACQWKSVFTCNDSWYAFNFTRYLAERTGTAATSVICWRNSGSGTSFIAEHHW